MVFIVDAATLPACVRPAKRDRDAAASDEPMQIGKRMAASNAFIASDAKRVLILSYFQFYFLLLFRGSIKRAILRICNSIVRSAVFVCVQLMMIDG